MLLWHQKSIGSVETTHGIILFLTDTPFVLVAGITDRMNQFDINVNGNVLRENVKTEAQNMYLNYLIPMLAGFVIK